MLWTPAFAGVTIQETFYEIIKEDVLKVITLADPGTQDYLWTIKETMGRMGEINRLSWSDVNLEER